MRRALCLIMCLAVLPGQIRAAERLGLFIGVSRYDASVTQLVGDLEGPGHDVALMVNTFLDAGLPAGNMQVLTDAPELLGREQASIAQHPTRAAILRAFDGLAHRAKLGDEVVIFLAGHGAQIAASEDEEEPDGLDEIFLPADFRIEGPAQYRNPLRDDEIGAAIDRLVARGAHVWMIADTCHSGSFRRSSGLDLRPRFVDLGAKASGPVDSNALDIAPVASGRAGSFVGFYGAAAGELAYETRPRGADGPHGLLSWSLARAIREGNSVTYQDMARSTARSLWREGRGLARPEFSGALSAVQMMARQADGPVGFAVSVTGDMLVFGGGRVDGLVPGTVMRVETAQGQALFDATITRSGATEASAPLQDEAMPALDALLQEEGLSPDRYRLRWLRDRAPLLQVRVMETPLDLRLGVSVDIDGFPGGMRDRVLAALQAETPALQVVERHGNITLSHRDGRIFVDPSPGGAEQSFSVPDQSERIPDLLHIIRRVSKTHRLLTMAEGVAGNEISGALTQSLTVLPGERGEDGGCQLSNSSVEDAALSGLALHQVTDCDQVVLSLRNNGPLDLDLTPLYLSADHQVHFLPGFTGSERGGWRIRAGAQGTLRYTEATQDSSGTILAHGPMHLLLIAVPSAPPGQPAHDFRDLQYDRLVPRTRSDGVQPFITFLQSVQNGFVTRSTIRHNDVSAIGALVLPMLTRTDRRDDF